MHFDFSTANRILFGAGSCAQVPALAKSFGRKTFLLTDSRARAGSLIQALGESGIKVVVFEVRKEPDINQVLVAMRIIHNSDFDLAIGMGGGATLDTGKACLALAANPGDPHEYLEVIGQGKPLTQPGLPFIAVPTTAGTGSEVTRNAVLAVPEQGLKVSLRSPFLLPTIAVVDPELTYSLPASLTASTGFDALTQVIEPYLSNTPNPLTDSLCREAISRAGRSLPAAIREGNHALAREDMALVSLFGGLALANARLGAVHGLAAALGGTYSAPHGALCARLLPLVLEVNLQALRSRQTGSPSLMRFQEVARLLTGNSEAIPEAAVDLLIEWQNEMGIYSLGTFGLKQQDFPGLIAQAQKASSMQGNPIRLTDEEVGHILEMAM